MNKPSIYDFLDVTQYLTSHFEWRKSVDSQFSIAKWAAELGFQSKVTLRFILKKQRSISSRMAAVLKANLKLSENEGLYFESLLAYTQAKTTTEKQALGVALMKLQRHQFHQTELPLDAVTRHVFSPIVLTLLTFNDFEKNKTNIAKLLMLEENQAEKILDDLEADGLITQNPDKTYQFTSATFRIPDSPSLKKFYEYWIDRSKAALELPMEVRRYRALKFALTEEEFKDVVEKMNEYSLLLLSKYQSSTLTGRKLYMYESAIFPISETLEFLNDSVVIQENQSH